MRGNKQERILRVLINSKEDLSKSGISKRAICSRQWVIQFLRKLEMKGIAKGTGIIDKRKALEYWISISKKKNKFRSYMVKEPIKVLGRSKLDYAITTYQAENIVQHYLFPSRIDIYIKESDLESWHSLITKHGLYGKGNFRILIKDNHVMHGKRKINDLFIVSLRQLIVDLTNEGTVCQEAAEM